MKLRVLSHLLPPWVRPVRGDEDPRAGMRSAEPSASAYSYSILAFQIQGENQGLVRTAASAQYRGVLGTILTMVRTEGPRSLYNGLVAGLQRQMSFASVRIGLYDSVKQFYTKGSERECAARTQLIMTLVCLAEWLL